MELVHPLSLPNGVVTKTIGFPVSMTNHRFEIYREPPELGAQTEEVFAEWLGAKMDAAAE